MLELKELTVQIGEEKVLNGLSLTVSEKEYLAYYARTAKKRPHSHKLFAVAAMPIVEVYL